MTKHPNNTDDAEIEKTRIIDFMKTCSVEVTPNGARKIDNFRAILKKGTKVYVTFLAGTRFEDTIRTVKRLHDEGMTVVPHIAARAIPSTKVLEESLKVLQAESEVTEVLLVAGGVSRPVGEFDSSIQVLETDLLQKYGINTVGIAGHPEGSPDIPDAKIAEALLQKTAYAKDNEIKMYILTQFCFESEPVIAWDRRIRAQGFTLPIHIGIPGLATLRALIRHAQACGIGPSMRILTRQAGNIAKLMTTRMPDKLVRDLANYTASNPDCGITECHLYPLGGLQKSAAWMYAVQDGAFELNPESGFRVLPDL
jgi:methylenetetrahydrofolate reductase (NADPH)